MQPESRELWVVLPSNTQSWRPLPPSFTDGHELSFGVTVISMVKWLHLWCSHRKKKWVSSTCEKHAAALSHSWGMRQCTETKPFYRWPFKQWALSSSNLRLKWNKKLCREVRNTLKTFSKTVSFHQIKNRTLKFVFVYISRLQTDFYQTMEAFEWSFGFSQCSWLCCSQYCLY